MIVADVALAGLVGMIALCCVYLALMALGQIFSALWRCVCQWRAKP